jgi:hypothetical protein
LSLSANASSRGDDPAWSRCPERAEGMGGRWVRSRAADAQAAMRERRAGAGGACGVGPTPDAEPSPRRGAGKCFERCAWHLFCGLVRAGSAPIARTAHRIRNTTSGNQGRGSIGQQVEALVGWCRACRTAALVIIKAQGKATQSGCLGLRWQRSSRSRSSRQALEPQQHSSSSRIKRRQCGRRRVPSSGAGVEVERSRGRATARALLRAGGPMQGA